MRKAKCKANYYIVIFELNETCHHNMVFCRAADAAAYIDWADIRPEKAKISPVTAYTPAEAAAYRVLADITMGKIIRGAKIRGFYPKW